MAIKIPIRAVIVPLDQQWALVALTRREVLALLIDDGVRRPEQTLNEIDANPGIGLISLNSTGAKVGRSYCKGPTAARSYFLSGYHHSGRDVAELVEVSA
jgi:hypothetical protein